MEGVRSTTDIILGFNLRRKHLLLVPIAERRTHVLHKVSRQSRRKSFEALVYDEPSWGHRILLLRKSWQQCNHRPLTNRRRDVPILVSVDRYSHITWRGFGQASKIGLDYDGPILVLVCLSLRITLREYILYHRRLGEPGRDAPIQELDNHTLCTTSLKYISQRCGIKWLGCDATRLVLVYM